MNMYFRRRFDLGEKGWYNADDHRIPEENDETYQGFICRSTGSDADNDSDGVGG